MAGQIDAGQLADFIHHRGRQRKTGHIGGTAIYIETMGDGTGVQIPAQVYPFHGVKRHHVIGLTGQGRPVVGVTHIVVLGVHEKWQHHTAGPNRYRRRQIMAQVSPLHLCIVIIPPPGQHLDRSTGLIADGCIELDPRP